MHKKEKTRAEKYITPRAVSEKTPPQSSWPITTHATLAWWRRKVWVVACAGARIYRTGTKYMLLLWHICISDVASSLVWPLPGTIPQLRDNWFKTQGYFTIKHNETSILSSTIYLKTNKNKDTTRIQILHRVYASHYLNQWWKNHCKAS